MPFKLIIKCNLTDDEKMTKWNVLNNKSTNHAQGAFVFLSAAEENNSTLGFYHRLFQPVRSLLFSGRGGGSLFLLLVLVFIFWLNEGPLFLLLNGEFEGSVVVTSAVVANASVPPELVDGEGHENNIGVVKLVIMANPAADEAPSSFNGWVSTKAGNFLRLTTYKEKSKFLSLIQKQLTKSWSRPEVLRSESSDRWCESLLVEIANQVRH